MLKNLHTYIMFLKWTRVFSTNFPPLWSFRLFFFQTLHLNDLWQLVKFWWNPERIGALGPNQCSSRKKRESCLWPGKNHYTLYTTQGRTNVPLYTLQYSIHWTTLGRTNAPPTPSASARKMILIRAQNNKLHLYTKSYNYKQSRLQTKNSTPMC